MDRNIGLEAVRLTDAAAIASARLMGRGGEKAADQAAVDAMRRQFNELSIRGTIVIGERAGERDEAPMLYIGEKVGAAGAGDPEVDIALDPLEGTTLYVEDLTAIILNRARHEKLIAEVRAAGARSYVEATQSFEHKPGFA